MPSPFFAAIPARSTQAMLLTLALVSSATLLTGCGANNPTTRTTSDNIVSTPSTASFALTLQSPVQLNNVQARVIDVASNQVLHQQLITRGDRLTVDIKQFSTRTQRLLYVDFQPATLGQSSYYDPSLDADAAFDTPLRALVSMAGGNQSQTIVIDPYSEIAFQRAQIRSGWLTNRRDVQQLGLINTDALTEANREVAAVFGVRSPRALQGLAQRDDLQKFTFITNQSSVLNYFLFALGHVQQYVAQTGDATKPYLAFSQKAAIDMLDGDLDGLTLYGFGDTESIYLADPLVAPILNTDPNRNQHALLALDQSSSRSRYNLAVGDQIKQLFNPLFTSDSAEFKLIKGYDYLNISSRTLSSTPRAFGLHSPGAGNYTRAFGLIDGQTTKYFLNADDTGLVSDIEQLAGIYQNPQACQLEIRPNGRVILSQNGQRFSADIDRNFSDSMSRNTADSQAYLINVTTPSDSMPSFLQIRTDGANIISAQYGRSLLDLPDQLSQVDLSCQF